MWCVVYVAVVVAAAASVSICFVVGARKAATTKLRRRPKTLILIKVRNSCGKELEESETG